jgi:hypothetical protein
MTGQPGADAGGFGVIRLLGATGGLRTGDMLGLLERRDVDLLRGQIRVERQAHEVLGVGRTLSTRSPTPASAPSACV